MTTAEITETHEATSVDLITNESIPDLEEGPATIQTESSNNNVETTSLPDQRIFDSTYDEYDGEVNQKINVLAELLTDTNE